MNPQSADRDSQGAHARRERREFLTIVALACCGVGNIAYYLVFSLA